jgi:hypothetical protein
MITKPRRKEIKKEEDGEAKHHQRIQINEFWYEYKGKI